MARRFSPAQRVALYLASDGKCAICGNTLGDDWHADHVVPFSQGGETDTMNGQALCPKCNIRKGVKMDELRKWQRLALADFQEHDSADFLAEATPGAGKTRFAIACISSEMADGVRRVFIVVPTEALKYQWADELASQGIQVEPSWDNSTGAFPLDMVGIVATYQQVQSAPDLFRRHASTVKSMAVFDEIHHCNENGSWGAAIRKAFDHNSCVRRLGLSGTPFRSDNNMIPFVRYIKGAGQPDFQYGYGEALQDEICRHVVFEKQGGTCEWYTPLGEHRVKTFDDDMAEEEENQRLRTAVDMSGDWMKGTIDRADSLLRELRRDDPDAAGLIVCTKQIEAQKVVQYMLSIGIEPVLVVSDEKNSAKNIKRFSSSSAPWIVAVRMVSEGIDIPRLRVGVYATVCTTPMFFRQLVGRFVRRQPDHEDHTAHVYIPDDDRLTDLAKEITQQVLHSLEEEQDRSPQASDGEREIDDGLYFRAIGSTAEHKGSIFQEQDFSVAELDMAKALLKRLGIDEAIFPAVKMAQAARIVQGDQWRPPPQQPPIVAPLHDEKKKLRERINSLARVIAAKFRVEHREVNWKINKAARVSNRNESTTLEGLGRCLEAAQRWMQEGELNVH